MKLINYENYDFSVMLATLIYLTVFAGICNIILACSKYIWDTTTVGFVALGYVVVSSIITGYKPNKGNKDEKL